MVVVQKKVNEDFFGGFQNRNFNGVFHFVGHEL